MQYVAKGQAVLSLRRPRDWRGAAGARLRAERLNIWRLFSPPQGIDDTPIVGLDQRRASGGDEIMGYKPIESYGVIGDLHTVALVGIDGSIDWCCLPHFDSPSAKSRAILTP